MRAIAETFGASIPAVAGWLNDAKIPRRSASDARPSAILKTRRVPRDFAMLNQLYTVEGRSAQEIATELGVEKISILRVLRELGIPRRQKRTEASLCRRAINVEAAGRLSKYEATLKAALEKRGLTPTPQCAAGRFNIDLAFPEDKLAIEVDGGNWHSTSRVKIEQDAEKESYLLATDWRVVRVKTRRQNWTSGAVAVIADLLRA